jgi:hypothetical protein
LVGNPDRRTGGRGQRVPDADWHLTPLSGPCRSELDPRGRLRGLAASPGPVVSVVSSSSMSTPVTVTPAACSGPAVITSAGPETGVIITPTPEQAVSVWQLIPSAAAQVG